MKFVPRPPISFARLLLRFPKVPRVPQSAAGLFALALVAALALATEPAIAAEWKWTGSISSDWQTAGNWVPATVPSGTLTRLNVNNGLNHELVYEASLGTTVSGSGGSRGLVIGGVANGGSGSMRITGGTFSSGLAHSPDVLGQNANTGLLTIDGGSYASGAPGIGIGISGSGTGILTLNSGSATITTLSFQASSGTLHLNGGTLTANAVFRSSGTGVFNFNGGTFRPGRDNRTLLESLNRVNVRDGGAVIDTGNFNLTLGQALAHSNISGDSTTDGGLTKLGAGTLTLAANNTYTGVTRVNGGTLAYGASDTLADNAGVLVHGGVLSLGTFSDTVGTVTLASGSMTSTSGSLTANSFVMQSGSASARFTGAGALTKTTDGTAVLTGTNTYTGGTSVNGGRLLVDGTHTGGGLYAINAGGTLGGTGTLSADVQVNTGGHLAPGASAGAFTIGNLTMNGGQLDFELGGTTPGSYDVLHVAGTATLGSGTIAVTRLDNYMPVLGSTYFVLTSDDTITSFFDGLANGDIFLSDKFLWQIRYNVNASTSDFTSGSGTDIALMAMATTIPEPSTYLLLALGALALWPVLRRRKK